MSDAESAQVEKAVAELTDIENEFKAADREIEKYQYKLLKPIFEKRSKVIANIPNFWPVALGNHTQFGQLINHDDAEILNYLDDVTVESTENEPWNYKVVMNFKSNPFFKDAKFIKEFKEDGNGTLVTEEVKIDWHEGKGPSANKSQEDDEISFFTEVIERDAAIYGDALKELYVQATRYYNNEEEEDVEDLGEYDLGEEDSEEEEEEEISMPPPKRSRKK